MAKKFKYVENKTGVVFEFSEEHSIPDGSKGYLSKDKDVFFKMVADCWGVEVDDVTQSIFYINVNDMKYVDDRGLSYPIKGELVDFIDNYEI
jgi:hypothetical protein